MSTVSKQPPRPTKKPVPSGVSAQKTLSTQKKPAPPPVKPQTQTRSTTASTPAKKPVLSNPSTQKAPAKAPTKTPTTVSRAASKPPTQQVAKAAQKPTAVASGGGGEKADNWISRTIQNQVAKVGEYAGGYVNSIGDKVNGVGEGIGKSISNQTRYWGEGVSGYGNNIKDSVGVGGPRVPNAGNPLGIAGQGTSNKGAPPGGDKGMGTRDGGKGSATNPLGV